MKHFNLKNISVKTKALTAISACIVALCSLPIANSMGDIKMPEYKWDSGILIFQVREPYPSRFTEADLVYGKVTRTDELTFVSNMAEKGIVFSDGILEDAIEFNAGMELKVSVAERIGRLVTNC